MIGAIDIARVGIVPPWLHPTPPVGGDTPVIMGDDDAYLPVLPTPPGPPDWDVAHYDHGDPGTLPDDLIGDDGVDERDLALGA